MKRFNPSLLPRPAYVAALFALPLALAGCAVGNMSNPFGSGESASNAEPLPPSKYPQPGSSATAGAPLPPSQYTQPASPTAYPGGPMPVSSAASEHCPQVVAWPQDKLVTVYEPGKVGDSLSMIHRGELTQLARECQLYGNQMTVRYGFSGRVLLGPKGRGGTISLPVSIRVSSADHKVIQSDQLRVAASVPPGNPVGYFSMVRQVSFPVAMGTRPEDYKIYVGLVKTQAGAS